MYFLSTSTQKYVVHNKYKCNRYLNFSPYWFLLLIFFFLFFMILGDFLNISYVFNALRLTHNTGDNPRTHSAAMGKFRKKYNQKTKGSNSSCAKEFFPS